MGFEPPIQPTLPALFSEAPAPSFTEVIAMIPNWADLSKTRRRDMASAIRCVARITGRELTNLRCDPGELNPLIFQRSAAACGLGLSRYQTILSLLRAVLRRVGRHALPARGEAGLGAEWRGFLERLPPKGALRAGLRRLARWSDLHSIIPVNLNDGDLALFLEQDRQTRISAAIHDQGRNLARAWNSAIQLQPDPTCFKGVSAPPKREPYTFPLTDYPNSFQDDVQAFMDERRRFERKHHATDEQGGRGNLRFRLPAGGPFSAPKVPGRQRRRKWKSSTVNSRTFSIVQAAAALVRTGTPIGQIQHLRDLVQPLAHAQRILEFFDNGVLRSEGGQIGQIGEVLRQITECHTDIPDGDRVAINEWAKEVRPPRQREMGPKAYACLKALIQPRARAVLLHLPGELVRRSKEDGLSGIERAKLVRLAVAISILTHIPLRISNLCGLNLTTHLVRLDGTKSPSHMIIEGDDTKNEEPIRCEIPAGTARLIQLYLDQHRGVLAPEGNIFLFSGRDQKAYSISAMRSAFEDTVERETGVEVYPHVMRHFAGWVLLKHHPGGYELVRRLLGHRDIATTQAFYLGLEADTAVRLQDAAVLKECKETKLLADAAFKRNRKAFRPRRRGKE